MRRSVLLFTAAFLLRITATGLGQTGSTLKKITAFDLPGPHGDLTGDCGFSVSLFSTRAMCEL